MNTRDPEELRMDAEDVLNEEKEIRAEMTKEPRPWTKEEAREKFLKHIWGLIQFWADAKVDNDLEKMEGLAFSILSSLDGTSMELPAYQVIPCPHPNDEEFHRVRGNNWYSDDIDIGGELHSNFYTYCPHKKLENEDG